MAAARRPPSSEPANVQLRRPTATARSSRSAVVKRLAGIAVLGDFGTLLAQPALQCDHERPAALLAHAHALLRRELLNDTHSHGSMECASANCSHRWKQGNTTLPCILSVVLARSPKDLGQLKRITARQAEAGRSAPIDPQPGAP